MRARVTRRGAAIAALVLAACGGTNAASQLAKPPEFDPPGQSKCTIQRSQAKPLIVEWPSADRGELEAHAHREGVVVVQYEGCEMRVLNGCTTLADYGYAAITRKKDRVVIRNADDLYANMPVGAAKLEARLEKSGELDVDMTMVGRWEAERRSVLPDELQGECTGATHTVSALTVGSFTFATGADAKVAGGASVLNAGAGGMSSARRETLNADGDEAACAKATLADKAPPEQCGAIIRVEVTPIGDASTSLAAQARDGVRLRDIEQLAASNKPADWTRARALLEPRVFGGPGHLEENAIRQAAAALNDLCVRQGDDRCANEISKTLTKLTRRLDLTFTDDLEKFFVPVRLTFAIDGTPQYSRTFTAPYDVRSPIQLPVYAGSVPLGRHTATAECTFRSPGKRYEFTVQARHEFQVLPGRDLGLTLRLYEPPESTHGPIENRAKVAWIELVGDKQAQFTTGLDRVETHEDTSAPSESTP